MIVGKYKFFKACYVCSWLRSLFIPNIVEYYEKEDHYCLYGFFSVAMVKHFWIVVGMLYWILCICNMLYGYALTHDASRVHCDISSQSALSTFRRFKANTILSSVLMYRRYNSFALGLELCLLWQKALLCPSCVLACMWKLFITVMDLSSSLMWSMTHSCVPLWIEYMTAIELLRYSQFGRYQYGWSFRFSRHFCQ